jgi:hypothetical protein
MPYVRYHQDNFLMWVPDYENTRAHSFGQFKKHALGAHAFPTRTRGQRELLLAQGSADLLSFGGVSVGCGVRFTV